MTAPQGLVAAAFAGDDVIEEEFVKDKAREAAADAPQDRDVTLPGWGVWGGAGVKHPFPKAFARRHVPRRGHVAQAQD